MNIGLGNLILLDNLIAIANPRSSLIKKIIKKKRKEGLLLDFTYGRKRRSLLITDKFVILSFITPKTLLKRANKKAISHWDMAGGTG